MRSVRMFILFGTVILPAQFNAQVQPGQCVTSKGVSFLLDAYLAALGACDCQRSGVILTDFPPCNSNPYQLAFEDNFDGESLDTSKWKESPHAQGALAGSQRMEYCSFRNISVKEGVCYITARKETLKARAFGWMGDNVIADDGLPNLREYHYTSGMMWTKKTFLYGKYEVRCRMPEGNGFWPAFWLFGGERYNELDILDSYAGTSRLISSMGHEFRKGVVDGCPDKQKGIDLTQWHVFTCEVERDKIRFYVDDRPVRTVYRVVTLSGDPVNCDDAIATGTYYQLESYVVEPMHIILDMFLISDKGPGGSKPVDASTPFPSSFEVDYVRYWQRAPASITVIPNPVRNKVRLICDVPGERARMYDGYGRLAAEINNKSLSYEFDLSGFSTGIYLASVEVGGVLLNTKIIKIE